MLRYAEHLDHLIALTTYLALTPEVSRTPQGLARDLSLREDVARASLEGFPSIFRKSRRTSPEGERYYTLHARYALRTGGPQANQAELRSDLLSTVLLFISRQAEQELASAHSERQQRQALVASIVAAVAGIVAALLASLAVILT